MIKTKRMMVLNSHRNPTIRNVNPANGSTTVPQSQIITITFSENIQPGPTYNNITVTNAAGIIKQMTKNINGNTLTLTPLWNYAIGTTYIINIPVNSIMDLTGNNLQTPLNSTFTVETTPE